MNFKFSVQSNSLTIGTSENNATLEQINEIAKLVTLQYIELIIIPDNDLTDEEVVQTLEVRNLIHARRQGCSITMAASSAELLLITEDISQLLMKKVYKISTIHHGNIVVTSDENQELMIKIAQRCAAEPDSSLKEIVIRACYSAGSIDEGLADPITLEPIGHIGLSHEFDESQTKQSRAFLQGEIGELDTAEYQRLKRLTLCTQTVSVKGGVLKNPDIPNVLYSMRQRLDAIPELRHLSVKAYYERVNPVPEAKPTRMGLWFSRDRPPNFFCPKAVRLISPDCKETGEKPNHLTRGINN